MGGPVGGTCTRKVHSELVVCAGCWGLLTDDASRRTLADSTGSLPGLRDVVLADNAPLFNALSTGALPGARDVVLVNNVPLSWV